MDGLKVEENITLSFARHALVVIAGFTLLFGWLYATPIVSGRLLAEADMYEEFLPQFLAPISAWSPYEFGGWPAFADFQDTPFYPLQLLGRLAGSWTAVILSSYVLASTFTYAYVYTLTRSRAAAAFAGLTFGLSEAMMERLPHVTVLQTTAWLPLLVLAIDRLRSTQGRAWVAIAAIAIGCAILGGHPPMLLYFTYACGLYALTGAIVERAGWRYFARLSAAAALGAALAAVKVLPLVEAMTQTARQRMGYSGFISNGNTPAQMLSALVPPIVHPGGEGATYVGLAALVMALVAVWRPFRNWRVAFWLALSVVSVLIASGDATPVARIAYELPFYDRFRIVSRHLIIAAFGVSALAGFGLAALRQGDAPRRAVLAAIAAVCAGLVAVVTAIAWWPDLFEIDTDHGLPWNLPIWHGAIWRQLAIGAATLGACAGMAWRPRSRRWLAAVIVVLVSDLVLALPSAVQLTGLDVRTIPRSATAPSVHTARLAAGMAPRHQRLLAPGGTTTDDVLPASFARVWQVPGAGGYNPMLLAGHGALAMMGTNGSVDRLLLADDNTALDLLAVKYVVMKGEELAPSATFDQDGVTWSSKRLDLPVGPPECGQRHLRRVTFALSSVDASDIALVARLRCSEDVPQGTAVAVLRVIGPAGEQYERHLLAGVDVADAGLADPGLKRRAKHTPARIFDDQEDSSLSYLARVVLPKPMRATALQIEVAGTAGWLEVSRLAVIDASGRSVPQETPAVLFNADRWREAARFATSRVTDRGRDEDGPDESPYVVFENQRALPRAWIAREVVPLDDKAQLNAVHHSLLPDGRHLNPAAMALVGSGTVPATTYPEGPSSAVIRAVRDGSFTIDVATTGGGFLVLSETFYPGWRARIGSQVLPVHRANISLQGVTVPAGYQRVEFEFVSTTLRAGAVVSVVALAVLALLAWRGMRRSSQA